MTTIVDGRFVIGTGMVGAAGGGFWCGFAFERALSVTGTLLDLVALAIAGLLTLVIAWYVWRAGDRAALLLYMVATGVAATIGPVLVF